MLMNQKAQAVLELAVLGSIIIAAFAILISYSEKYNRQQSYMQQTFRTALKEAKNISGSVSLSAIDFRRMPNVTNPMEIGKLQKFSSSSRVLWTDGKKNPDGTGPFLSKSKYQVNRGAPIDITSSGALPGETKVSVFQYTSSLNSTTTLNKQENNGNITTRKSLNAQDTITGSTDVGGTNVSLNSVLGVGGKYNTTGAGVNRQTNLQ